MVCWFGGDLRAGQCEVRPGVETREKLTLPQDWRGGGVDRAGAHLISQSADGHASYGGTPSDASIIACIEELKARGLSVTYSPFLLMDIPPGNGLPDPHGGAGQAAFPWRGRIRPAASDKTAACRAELDAFFGTATASMFGVTSAGVTYTGPADWSWSRFVLHQAALAKAAGGVTRFLLGSELVGLTQARDEAGGFPAAAHLVRLAAEVRALLGPDTDISYAADWTEYGAYVPGDGSGDVLFPLDPVLGRSECRFHRCGLVRANG